MGLYSIELALPNTRLVERQSPAGSFSALVAGSGPPIVCLHGFPDNRHTFKYQLPVLVRAGYRVVVPVMRGYEPGSVQKDNQYFVRNLAEDVLSWMDELDMPEAHVLGHDWGGITAWAVAALAPDRVMSATTIAMPYMRNFYKGLLKVPLQLAYSWYAHFFQVRLFSDLWLSQDNYKAVDQLWRRWSPDWDIPEGLLESVKETLGQPGVKSAALAYYRCFYDRFSDEGRTSNKLLSTVIEVPAMAIAGGRDGCIHKRLFDTLMNKRYFKEGLNYNCIDDAGHFVHLEKPDEVNTLLLDFFATVPGNPCPPIKRQELETFNSGSRVT